MIAIDNKMTRWSIRVVVINSMKNVPVHNWNREKGKRRKLVQGAVQHDDGGLEFDNIARAVWVAT